MTSVARSARFIALALGLPLPAGDPAAAQSGYSFANTPTGPQRAKECERFCRAPTSPDYLSLGQSLSSAGLPHYVRLSMNHDSYPDSYIRGILNTVKSIAMVGISPKDNRPSYFAFKYLLERGYDMIPVNPGQAGKEILGRKVHARLSDIPGPIDMVDVFRAARYAVPIVEETLALNPRPRVIWMQLGVRNDEAAAKAEAGGMKVVMNRCPKIEYGRLSSEIGWIGVNSRTLSSKRAPLLGKGVQRMSLNRTTMVGASADAAQRAQKDSSGDPT